MKAFLNILILMNCLTQIAHAQVVAASSQSQWTGVAIDREQRIYVNFPRWRKKIKYSVATVDRGELSPFPSSDWNDWNLGDSISNKKFVAVQSVVTDALDRLWVLDTGNPMFQGVIKSATRLFVFDSKTRTHLKTYSFDSEILTSNSYLNDVRIDIVHQFAYLTDSGEGAIVALNLKTGQSKKWLDKSATTKSEAINVTIDGRVWRENGKRPDVHSDGIAYDSSNDTIYFQALTGTTLYSVSASLLRDFQTPDLEVARQTKKIANVGPSDGLLVDRAGRVLLTSLEHNAVRRLERDGSISTVYKNKRLQWPDSLSFDASGNLFVTSSQIHLKPNERTDFKIFKIKYE